VPGAPGIAAGLAFAWAPATSPWDTTEVELGWVNDQIDKVICHQVGSGHRETILQALLPDDLESWAEVAQELRTHWKADGVALARRRPLLLRALNELYREVA